MSMLGVGRGGKGRRGEERDGGRREWEDGNQGGCRLEESTRRDVPRLWSLAVTAAVTARVQDTPRNRQSCSDGDGTPARPLFCQQ